MCASDAFLRDEAQYCSDEDMLKEAISKLALGLVIVTLLFSFAITFRQMRVAYFSASASKIVLERCKLLGMEGEDSKVLNMETLNQVELDEIFQGTWLHAWASRIRERAERLHTDNSFRFGFFSSVFFLSCVCMGVRGCALRRSNVSERH